MLRWLKSDRLIGVDLGLCTSATPGLIDEGAVLIDEGKLSWLAEC